MNGNETTEIALSQNPYDIIAFKGQNPQYLAGVIKEITELSSKGPIYPPHFVTSHKPRPENRILLQPDTQYAGRLSPAEAVAMQVIADAGSAIAKILAKGSDGAKLVRRTVGYPGCWLGDIVVGIASFGYNLRGAMRIRRRIAEGEAIPKNRTFRDLLDIDLLQTYDEPLKLDGMVIKENTVAAAIKSASESAENERKINEFPRSTKDEKVLQNRRRSKRRGVELGATIYLRILKLAIKRGLSATLEKKVNT